MRCPYCYNEQPDGNGFCEKCGANLKPAQAQSQSPFAPPEQQAFNPYQQNQQQQNQQGYNPYQQQGQGGFYQPPIQPSAPQQNNGRGFSIASLVLGIVSIPCCGYGWITGILAIIFGVLALKKLKKTGAPTGKATAGLVMGIIGLFWFIYFVYAMITGMDAILDELNNFIFYPVLSYLCR